MTDAERDELIEKSLLNELDAASEARVQQLRQEDEAFRQEFDFQEMLTTQVRLKRRKELLDMFDGFESEQAAANEGTQIPIMALGNAGQHDVSSDAPPVIPLWRQSWFRVAAGIVLTVLLGAVVWWKLSRYDPKPIATGIEDSIKSPLPTAGSPQNDPAESPRLPVPHPIDPVAQSGKAARLKGPSRLPYYETDDIRLGFGKGRKDREYRTVIFETGPTAAYEFQDTLRVFMPVLPAAKPAWSLVYNRSTDTYYLISGQIRYEVIRGLQGREPLRREPASTLPK
ncbi:hypothetical protein [Spirosoma sp.]|uniref:hypothetical protein n=1 Tax=Spirosoma sp. TaxID=1899569 RepID=UPI002608A322|nr:hypothetical protein [Spirosoma sp.]MCX6214611.1 hypothetical protein [Spirosoma sp.]